MNLDRRRSARMPHDRPRTVDGHASQAQRADSSHYRVDSIVEERQRPRPRWMIGAETQPQGKRRADGFVG